MTKSTGMIKGILAIMLLLSIGLLLNKSGITGFATVEYTSIDNIVTLDVTDLKYELIAGEEKSFVFYAKNHLDQQIEVEVGSAGKASNFISIDQKNYLMGAQDSIPIQVRIGSPLEAIPQSYFGEIIVTTEGKGKIIPIQITVKKRIQDAIKSVIELDKEAYLPGDEATVRVTTSSTANEPVEARVELVLTSGLKEIYRDDELFTLTDQDSRNFVIRLPENLPPGSYSLAMTLNAKMGKQYNVVEQHSSINIELPKESEKPSQTKNTLLWWIIGVVALSVLLSGTVALVKQEVLVMPKFVQVLGAKKEEDEEQHFIKEGFSYLIDEKGTRRSYEALRMLHHEGYKAMCITRLNPKLLVEEIPEFRSIKVYWLTTQEADSTLGPTDIEGIYNSVEKFLDENSKAAILLDGLSFLAVNVSFSQVILLMQYIKDKVSTTNSIFIAPLNMTSLNKKEREQIIGEIPVIDGQKEILLEIYRKADEKSFERDAQEIEISEELLGYAREMVRAGMPKAKLIDTLMEHGWPEKVALEAIGKIKDEAQAQLPKQEESRVFGQVIDTNAPRLESGAQETKMQGMDAPEEKPIQAAQPLSAPQANQKIDMQLRKTRQHFFMVEQMLYNAMAEGKETEKADMDLALLTSDLEIAAITRDDKDIAKVDAKLEEIKKKLQG